MPDASGTTREMGPMVAFASAKGAPDARAGGDTVITFVKANSSAMQTSDVLWTLAFAFLVFFAGTLRALLRATPAQDALGAVVLAGGAMFAVGACAYFGFDFVLGVDGSHLDPAGAQTLNALALHFVLPMCVGGFVLGVGILRGAQLPHWLGWLALLLAVVAMTPAVLGAVVGYFVWAATTSVLIFRHTAVDIRQPVEPARPA